MNDTVDLLRRAYYVQSGNEQHRRAAGTVEVPTLRVEKDLHRLMACVEPARPGAEVYYNLLPYLYD